jgi:hypothetical protein
VATTECKTGELARAFAVAANTRGRSERDLHILHRKRHHLKVRNYTALVWWHTKVTVYRKKPTE